MNSIFMTIMVVASILVLCILPKIGNQPKENDVHNNWHSVWKERLKIDN